MPQKPSGSASTPVWRILVLTFLVLAAHHSAAADVWVMGYYVGYHRGLQPPERIDYTAMTHIVVGAALPQADGTFDTQFYLGPTTGPAWARDTVTRAHAAGIKAVLMVGGAGDAIIAAFRATRTPTVRAAFVRNLATLVDSIGFDGVDLDWEPIAIGGDPAADDRNLLVTLSQELRAALPGKIMTLPVGWNNRNFNNMAHPFYGQISAYYDRVNMMSYQMNWIGSGWESWHSSPLYGATSATPSSIDDTMRALLAAGVPKAKIGIGMGFYGQPYENGVWRDGRFVHDVAGSFITIPHQGTERAAIRVSDNEASYSAIMRYYFESGALRWDDTAKSPYLSFTTPKQIAVPTWADPPIRTTYVAFENERSIAAKGEYVRREGLGGTIIWTISQGYLEWRTSGERDPLMKAVKAAFLPDTPSVVRIVAPNGGESWRMGTSQSITWQADGIGGTLTLELWRNGARVGTIAEGLAPAPTSYSWTVGNFVGGSAVPGGGYTVRVLAGGKSDDSDAAFTIWTPGLTVTSPNGGESWTRHENRRIQWSSQGLSGNVKLELLSDGVALGIVADNVPITAAGFNWDVGFVGGAFPAAGSTYTVRVSTVDNLYSDASDAAFTLVNRTPVSPAASDFNRDGKTDIFWRYYNTGGFNCVWLMGLSGSPIVPAAVFSAPAVEMDTPPPSSRTMADMESDAPRPTPTVPDNAPFTVAVDDIMDADAPLADPPLADPRTLGYARALPAAGPLAWRMGGVADFDGDGQPDILWRNTTDGRNVVWLMNGFLVRAVAQLQQVATSLNWEIGGVGDFDADGKVDILWRNYGNGRNVVWLMDRFTIRQVAALPTETDANWRITTVCDITNDGHPDIFWRHVGDGRNLVWLMNGVNQAGVTSLPTVVNPSWEMAACGDFTGDGEMDLVWRNTSDGRVVVWRMDRFSLMGTVPLPTIGDPDWKIEN